MPGCRIDVLPPVPTSDARANYALTASEMALRPETDPQPAADADHRVGNMFPSTEGPAWSRGKRPGETPGVYPSGSCCITAQPLEPDMAPEERGQGQLRAPLRDALGQAPDPRRGHSLRSSPAKARVHLSVTVGRRRLVIVRRLMSPRSRCTRIVQGAEAVTSKGGGHFVVPGATPCPYPRPR